MAGRAGKPRRADSPPAIRKIIRESFAAQSFMTTLGARLAEIGPGRVRISCRPPQGLAQQHGHLHAGVAASIADSACGYAALSLAPPGSEVLTVEFKANFLRPASGSAFEAIGVVRKAGRTISVCEGEVWETRPQRRLIATMSATMFLWRDRQGSGDG